ncbi:MAG TPA: hypothetical protein EYN66_18115 [Myxococcales bacterium]|nr:hypothetical protein [Myxococcales bacterium]
MSDTENTNGAIAPTTHGATAPITTSHVATGTPVPSFRLEQEISANRQLKETAQVHSTQIADLTQALEASNAALAATKLNHGQEMHLIDQGFKAPSVRRFFRREYQAAVQELPTDGRPGFDAWLEANREDPLYAVHFERRIAATTAPTPDTQNQAAPAQADPMADMYKAFQKAMGANPTAGTGQPAENTGKDWADVTELRQQRARNGGTLGGDRDAIKAQLRAKGLIK